MIQPLFPNNNCQTTGLQNGVCFPAPLLNPTPASFKSCSMTIVHWDALKEDMSGEYIGHSDALMSPWPPECLTVCRNESFFSSQAQSPIQEAALDLLSSPANMEVQLDNNPDWSGHAEPVQTNGHSALYFLWALHSFKTQ